MVVGDAEGNAFAGLAKGRRPAQKRLIPDQSEEGDVVKRRKPEFAKIARDQLEDVDHGCRVTGRTA
jgi:hypothetical protein